MKLSNLLVDQDGRLVNGKTLSQDQIMSGEYRQFDELLEDALDLISKEEILKFIEKPFTSVGVVKE